MQKPIKETDEGTFALLAIILLAPSLLWSAFVFMKLWLWFISGPFDVQALGLAEAVGILILLTYAKYWGYRDRYWVSLSASFIMPLILLVLGAITKAFL